MASESGKPNQAAIDIAELCVAHGKPEMVCDLLRRQVTIAEAHQELMALEGARVN